MAALSPRAKSLAKKIARRLPKRVLDKILDSTSTQQYALNTRGLVADSDMVAWARRAARPVSIVIPSYNDVPLLTACLASIEATCADFTYEVIVVDDYCQPENSERLRALESPTVRVVFKDERQGFAVTVNVGMALAQYDIVLLNSDIVAKPGWLHALQYSAHEIDPKIGLVSPKLVYPNGAIQYGGTYYARLLAPQWFGHLFVGSAATRPVANVATYNRSISGACVYITRDAYSTLGPLDEEYWLGFEDVDYGLRAWQEGIRCYYQPAAMLVHHESASRGYSQGQRELGSMRYFWRRWSGQFLSRTSPETPAVDYVLSPAATPAWREYVVEQASRLRALGHSADVHEIAPGGVDEALVGLLSGRESIKVSCDWATSETVWLASLHHGKPAYLLPGVESGRFPDDRARQNSIIANYKPEFEYIAPNRWTADQLRAEAAWEVRGRLVPVSAPVPVPGNGARDSVVTVGLDPSTRASVDAAAAELAVEVRHFDETEPSAATIAEINALSPRVVVALAEYDTSLTPLALMGLGAAYVGRLNDKTRYEVLDGYNALLIDPSSAPTIPRALGDLFHDDLAWRELGANGRDTAERMHGLNAGEMSRLLATIAAVAV
jgi:GT2 family glycosyltransferase